MGIHFGILKSISIFYLSVSAYYSESYEGETAETQRDRAQRLLNGEQGLTCTYSNCNGESEFGIKDNMFWLGGGAYADNSFGTTVSLTCSYLDNKEQVDKFYVDC
jgi:hypothetical protein